MAGILEQPEDNSNTPIPRIKPISDKALQADRVSVAVNRGLMGNPADAARRKEYSKELGVEPHEIGDLNEAKAEVIKKRSKMAQLIETNPGLARYLLNNPITPELAAEDLPALHKIARAWRRTALDPIVQVFGKGSSMLAQGAVGAADIATRFVPGKTQDLGKTLEDAGFKFKELDQILEGMLSPEQQLANMKRAEQKTFTGALEAMVESPSSATDMVFSSLLPMAAGGVLGGVLKKVAPGVSAAVAAALGESIVITGGLQEKIRQESKTGTTTEAQKSIATLAGAAAGGLSMVSNLIARRLNIPDVDSYIAAGSLKGALAASKTPPSVAKVILGGAVTEGVLEEMPQSVIEQFAENVALGKQWDDGLGAAAAQGLVAGSLTQLGFSPMMVRDAQNTIEDNISRERHKAASDALQKTFKAMRAEGTRDMLAKVGDAVSESNLRNLSTDAFAEFVDHMAEDSDVDAVYIPVEKLDEVLLQSGMTESELTDKMPEVADNIRIARATKGDVRIPVKDYLVNFAGTPTEKSLLDHLKIDPEGMTFAESQEFMQSQQAEFAEQAQQIIAADEPVLSAEEYAKQPVEGKTYKQYLQEHPDQNAVIEADSKNVEKVIVGELNKAGRFNREANAVYAVPFREFFRTAAIRETRSTGKLVTPTEIYERYPLKYQMRGETPTATPDTLTQPVTAATPEDFTTENIQDILKNGNWMIVAATNPGGHTPSNISEVNITQQEDGSVVYEVKRVYEDTGEEYSSTYSILRRGDGTYVLERKTVSPLHPEGVYHYLTNEYDWKRGRVSTVIGAGAFNDIKEVFTELKHATDFVEATSGMAADREANTKAHEKLIADLDARGLKYEVVYGRYPGDAAEMPSVLVYDVDNATARDFANRYDQDSVLVRDGFIYRDGQVKPHLGNVTTYSDTASAFSAGGYTRVPSTGAIFSVDFDWDANDRYTPGADFYAQLTIQKPGSMTLVGVHYSHEKRTVLEGTRYGEGMRGAERDRVLYGANTDGNIKTRVDFYTDTGNGVTPESGLGGVKHEVLLTDIYDASTNPLNLSYPPTWDGGNTFEQQVIANGFKGYFVNQGKQGRVVLLGEAARAVPVPTPEQLLAEKYQATQQYFQPVVSTRTPKPVAGRADPHLSSGLAVDLDALYASDNMTTKLAGIVNLYDGFIPSTGTDPQEVLESFINQVEQNLDWLYRQVPPEVVARSRQWYDGGRVIVDRLVDRYAGKYTPAQMAAALALLSPQTAWDKNVSLSERTVDIWTNQQDTEWSKDMSKTLKRLIDKIRKEEKPAVAKVKIAKLKAAEGFKLSELATDYARGVWIRVYDETYNPRGYRKLSPEGGFLDFALKSDGITIDPASWLSFTNIGKVVGVLRDASMPNISRKLGGNHKVRNFYNNLIAPSDPLSVTIDTHAVAAGHLLPLGSSSYEVKVALGSTVSSDPQGLSGSYVLYTEAYRRVAAKYGLLPRELQSIAWEALRGLFTPAFKARYQKDEALQAQFRELTEKLRIGETTHAEVAERIKDIAGGIQNPSWYGSGPRLDAGDPGSSYTGELLGARGSAGAIRSRARSGGPEGVPTLGLFEAVGLAAQQRAAAVNTNRPGGGTAAFFTKMTLGLDGKPGVSYRPVLPLGSEHVSFIQEYSKHRGNFDSHIRASIPGFGEVQVYTGQAIVDAYPEGANVLDIGASEGSWAKTITALSGSKIKTDSLEPLEAMAASFQNISTVEGARLLPQAFGDTGWVEEETGFVVEPFAPEGKYDVIHEAMTFQFIDKDRGEQIDRVKRYMSPDGIYLTEEKFANDGSAAYKEREALKDRYKARYFTSEAIADKAKEVLTVGMNDLMVEQQSLEATLKERFKYVVQYWSAANFGGYIASDSAAAVKNFLDKLPSTESEYSNQPPHRVVKGRLKLSEARKVSVTKLDDVLNQSSFYSALEREIGGLNKIANKEGAVKPDQAIKWIEARQKEGKFKKEEVEAVGILDWLQTRTGDVKVAAIEDFVRQNGVQLEVVFVGEEIDEDRVRDLAREDFDNNFDVRDSSFYEDLVYDATLDTAQKMLDNPEHFLWEELGENWHDTEGLESYSRSDVSELAHRLQQEMRVEEIIGSEEHIDIIDQAYDAAWEQYQYVYLGDAREYLFEEGEAYLAEYDDYQLDNGDNYREILFRLPHLDLRGGFVSPHFRRDLSSNLIAHTRVNERVANTPYTPEQKARLDEFEKQYAEWVAGNKELKDLLAVRDKSSEDLRDAANGRVITPELEAEDPVLAEAANRNRRLSAEVKALQETRRAVEPKRPDIKAGRERVLFVEEVQSDWAQQGRDYGFILKKPPKLTAEELEYEAIIARINSPENTNLNKLAGVPPTKEEQERLEELRARNVDKSYEKKTKPGVNAAPFVTDTQAWVTLVTKRLLRYAAENGFTRISWTTGAQQAERYRTALLAQVDEIRYTKNKYGTYSFQLYKDDRATNTRIWEENVSADRIMAVFGKDIGEKIVNSPVTEGDDVHVLAADDLTVGGSGMKDFYDKLLPSVVSKVTKSLGGSGKVELIDFTGKGEVYDDKIGVQQSIAITPDMVERIMSGLPLFKGERGSFNPNTFITTLISGDQGSDKSTVIHEGGHFYLEALADMASRPDAPQQVKDDFRKTLDWFGIKGDALEEVWASMTLEQKRPFHEQWAQSFERYIMEGKAPTVEMQPVFARFRAWMVSVYKSIKEFLKQNPLAGKLNDDVRAIFDRLLATEEKIAEMERARSMMPLFASADQAGVTQAKFEAYLAEGQAATDEAISQLAARSLRDMKWASGARDKALRQLQREAKAKRKALTEEVAAEVAQEPITQARNFLLRGIITGDDGVKTKASTTFKLDRGAINELYPGIDLTRIEKMVSDAGMSPDVAAQMFGFNSGQELIDALLNEESTTDKIQGLVDQRMLERYGDLVDDRAIEAAADKAIHNRVRAKFLATGLAMLKGQPGTAKDLNKAARLAAEGALGSKKVRDITPGQYAAAERRANAEALKRVKENPASAIEAQRAALLNNHMARIARDIREEVEAGLRYVKKFDKKELRKLLGPEYIEQIDDLLSGFDFRKGTSLAQIDKLQSLRDWIEDQETEGLDPAIDADLVEALKTKSYKEMTIEEFRSLIDAVKQIEHLGRLKNKLLTAKEQKEFRATVDEAEQSIRDNANRTVTERETPSDVFGKVGKWVRQMFASHRKFNSVIREMDGFKNAGVMWRILARPMNEAGDREVEMRQQAAEQIAKLFGMLEKKDTVPGNLYSKKRLVPGTNISMTQEQRIMFGMNWGNEGNRQRLMDGGLTGRKALSAQEAQAILDTITKEEWDFIQGVLDFVGSYKDQIAALEKQLTGIEPKWIEASPIITKFGTYRGGYFPAKYDADLSTRSEVLEAVNDLRMGMKGAFGAAATRNGYTKERSKQVIGRPILLSFNTISQHVSEVTHRLAWQPWLIDANRLLRALDEPIREHYGTEILRELRNTVLDIATGDVGAKNAMEAAINHLRTGSTIVGMGWRVTTALLQPSGLAQSWTRLGSRWATAGVARYLKNPLEAGRFVDEKSSLMRNRGITMQREINEVLNTLRSGDKVSAVTGSYFTMIGKMQRTVDIPTWIGAYEKHLYELGYEAAEGEDERQRMENEAIAIADQTVIDTQSGGQIKDLAGIQRGSPVQKLFTNFYSYFSATYNLNVETVRRTDFRDPASVGLMAVDLLLLNTAPVLFAVALKNMMKGGCDWGDTECMLDKVAQEQVSFLMGQMVVLREVAVAGQAVIGGDAYGYQGPAGLRFFSDLYKLGTQVEQGDADFAAFKAANSVAGALFHYPAGQINSTLDGILAIEDGRVEGVSILPALIAGAPKE